jgi:hypothetical protein
MSDETSVNRLAGAAGAVARAESPADVFKALLEAGRVAVPRAFVFLLRGGDLHGWGSVGHPPGVARSQRAFRASLDRGWLAEVARAAGAPRPRPADSNEPDCGQAVAADAVGCVVCLDGKPIALIVGERAAGEEPWLPEGLALLADVARLRLELNLARRKLAAVAPDGASEHPAEPATAAAAPADVAAGEQIPPAVEVARRYARLVATDIRLYNEEAVMLGRRNGDLLDRLGDQIGRGKETFLRRHGELGPAGLELLHEAYVQVLAGGDTDLIPSSVLD